MTTIPKHPRLYWLLCGLILLLIIAGRFFLRTARAASFPIACTDVAGLISAIITANSNGEADTITLAPDCTYTFLAEDNDTDGPNGLPPITSEIFIDGNRATLTRDGGAPAFRFFRLGAAISRSRT
jgi:hypothetical protein